MKQHVVARMKNKILCEYKIILLNKGKMRRGD